MSCPHCPAPRHGFGTPKMLECQPKTSDVRRPVPKKGRKAVRKEAPINVPRPSTARTAGRAAQRPPIDVLLFACAAVDAHA